MTRIGRDDGVGRMVVVMLSEWSLEVVHRLLDVCGGSRIVACRRKGELWMM